MFPAVAARALYQILEGVTGIGDWSGGVGGRVLLLSCKAWAGSGF